MSVYNFIKQTLIVFLFFSLLGSFGFAEQTKELDYSRVKDQISQIELSYNQGRESFTKGDFFASIINFNRVIELEKNFYLVYTPYAKKYIEKAQEKLKEKEETNLKLDTEKKLEVRQPEPKPEPKVEVKKTEIEIPQKEEKEDSESKAVIATPEAISSPQILEYIIGVGDELAISVWRESSLSQNVVVRPDGRTSFLLAGDFKVAGLTLNELNAKLVKRFKDYVKFPVVSITLLKMGGKRILVLGEVNSQGIYLLTRERTILELIAMAGGFTQDAVKSSVLLIRGGLHHPEGKRLDLSRAIEKADMSQNVTLLPEDIVYVPKTFISDVNYTLGQILNPLYQGFYIRSQIRTP